MSNSMFDELKEVKYFKKITDFQSLIMMLLITFSADWYYFIRSNLKFICF